MTEGRDWSGEALEVQESLCRLTRDAAREIQLLRQENARLAQELDLLRSRLGQFDEIPASVPSLAPRRSDRRESMRLRVSGALHMQGASLALWAEDHGFGYSAVMQVLHRFAGSEKRPQGALGRAIIEGLEAETGLVICGPDVQAAA